MQQSFQESFQQAYDSEDKRRANEFSNEYLKGARESFVKDSVFMESRQQFEEYMRVMENKFYETANLPKSPYVDAKRREGEPLPAYPPKAYATNQESATRGSRRAEEFIDQLLGLNAKRRGLSGSTGKQTRQHKQGAATLNLSGGQQAQFQSPTADKLNSSRPFYDSLIEKPQMSAAARETHHLIGQEGLAGMQFQEQATRNERIQNFATSSNNPMNSSMSKFVAGSFRPEKSDLAVPNNDYWTKNQPNPPASAAEPYICDLSTPDAQYERYKNLMKSKYYNLNVNSTTGINETSAKYLQQPSPFTGYSQVIQDQRKSMMDQLRDPTSAGPALLKTVKEQPDQIRGPNLVQIYQAPPKVQPPPPKPDGGFACHTMNNTVTKEVLESLGGLKDTIRPIQASLTTHEMRPYEVQPNYRQQLLDMKKEDQESVRASISCLRGEPIEGPPRSLYQRDQDGGITNGVNMIGKARLVSASPFRASIKLEKEKLMNDSDNDENFEREDDLPELNKIRDSPIKDDSALLRHQKNEFLTAFSQSQRQDGLDNIDLKSERTPTITGGDLKGIMIHETRTSFDKTRNSHVAAGNHASPMRNYRSEIDDSVVLQTPNDNRHHHRQDSRESALLQMVAPGLPRPGEFMNGFKQRSSNLRSQREIQLQSYNRGTALAK